jgi:hypothetical protein
MKRISEVTASVSNESREIVKWKLQYSRRNYSGPFRPPISAGRGGKSTGRFNLRTLLVIGAGGRTAGGAGVERAIGFLREKR